MKNGPKEGSRNNIQTIEINFLKGCHFMLKVPGGYGESMVNVCAGRRLWGMLASMFCKLNWVSPGPMGDLRSVREPPKHLSQLPGGGRSQHALDVLPCRTDV